MKDRLSLKTMTESDALRPKHLTIRQMGMMKITKQNTQEKVS